VVRCERDGARRLSVHAARSPETLNCLSDAAVINEAKRSSTEGSRAQALSGRRSRSEATDIHRPSAHRTTRSQMSCEKGTPPRREGLSEAGALGGGRTKPADEREPIAPLKSRISDERIGRAPIGRGRHILTVKRGWRSRSSRRARGLSAQRRLAAARRAIAAAGQAALTSMRGRSACRSAIASRAYGARRY
jgi:hypothetical protein